ncbi:MAG: rhomboid family intramembrane serine protease [Bacteroidetes bacterium]|nr:rhomboid family intramembrane serine protease [Bacteroidota bacterium]
MQNPVKELRNAIVRSAFLPFLFLSICWLVFLIEIFAHYSLSDFGIQPRTLVGLRGVLFMPFLHGDVEHLLNNSFAFGTLATMLFFFYREIALTVFLWVFFMSGIWTWSLAVGGTHIGASAIIYGLFSFLALSGMIRRNKNLLALTFLVIFAHQGIVWGALPGKPNISWEGHLAGLLAGIILAIYFRKQGPQREVVPVDDDDTHNEFRFGRFYWDEKKREEEARKEAERREAEQSIIYHYKEGE